MTTRKAERNSLWSHNADQAGMELPDRPRKLEIWTNRKLNLRNFDRMHYEGWKFMPNKYLDLIKEEGYNMLGVMPRKPNILNIVNLHDEIPDGIRAKRQEDPDEEPEEEEEAPRPTKKKDKGKGKPEVSKPGTKPPPSTKPKPKKKKEAKDDEQTDPKGEYNIREMWKRLEDEEPSAVAEA